MPPMGGAQLDPTQVLALADYVLVAQPPEWRVRPATTFATTMSNDKKG